MGAGAQSPLVAGNVKTEMIAGQRRSWFMGRLGFQFLQVLEIL
jgi:hypothetical protein